MSCKGRTAHQLEVQVALAASTTVKGVWVPGALVPPTLAREECLGGGLHLGSEKELLLVERDELS